MAGDQVARILDAEAPLQRRFEQVAALGDRAGGEPEQQHSAHVGGRRRRDRQARRAPPQTTPTRKPDQVLAGDTRGQSFGPPISRPPK